MKKRVIDNLVEQLDSLSIESNALSVDLENYRNAKGDQTGHDAGRDMIRVKNMLPTMLEIVQNARVQLAEKLGNSEAARRINATDQGGKRTKHPDILLGLRTKSD